MKKKRKKRKFSEVVEEKLTVLNERLWEFDKWCFAETLRLMGWKKDVKKEDRRLDRDRRRDRD
jgi:hypothetical protein